MSERSPDANPSSSRWLRKLLLGLLLSFLGIIALAGTWFGVSYQFQLRAAQQGLETEIALLHASGAPLTSIDLDAQYAAEWEGPNLTPELAAIVEAGRDPDRSKKIFDHPPPLSREPWKVQELAEEYLRANQPAIDYLEALCERKEPYHFAVDYSPGIFAQLPHVTSITTGARFYSWRFHIAWRKNDRATAVSTIVRRLQMADMLRTDAASVSQIMRSRIYYHTLFELEALMQDTFLPADERSAIRRELQKFNLQETVNRCLSGERAMLYTESTWPATMRTEAPTSDHNRQNIARLASLPTPAPIDMERMLGHFRDVLEANERSPRRFTGRCRIIAFELEELNETRQRSVYPLTVKHLPKIFMHACEYLVGCKARVQSADVALAALEFHEAHGEWPRFSHELHPDYVADWPEDPYEIFEYPLEVVISPEFFRVYSVGFNREDDGGKCSRDNELDIGFGVPAPRKPAQDLTR